MSEHHTSPVIPYSIETPRLRLRCWQPSDAIPLKDAIDSSLPQLQTWVDWTLDHPMPIAMLQAQLSTLRDRFAAGEDWTFGIFDLQETRLLGGAGVHPRGCERSGRTRVLAAQRRDRSGIRPGGSDGAVCPCLPLP